jgi:hypothetical protein
MGRWWWVRAWPDHRCEEEANVASQAKKRGGEKDRSSAKDHFEVSELISDRPAAPSPFGDDQTFPLPVERLTYKYTMAQ